MAGAASLPPTPLWAASRGDSQREPRREKRGSRRAETGAPADGPL